MDLKAQVEGATDRTRAALAVAIEAVRRRLPAAKARALMAWRRSAAFFVEGGLETPRRSWRDLMQDIRWLRAAPALAIFAVGFIGLVLLALHGRPHAYPEPLPDEEIVARLEAARAKFDPNGPRKS